MLARLRPISHLLAAISLGVGVTCAIAQPTPTPTNTSVTANKTTGVIVAPVDLATFKTANDLADASDTTAALAGKQPLAAELTALSAINGQAFGRSLLESASAAETRADLSLSLDTPGGIPRLGDARASIPAQRILWRNATKPIALTDGTDENQNLWPWNASFYDESRDQIVVGYTSGSIRAEVGSTAAYGKYPVVRIITNAAAAKSYDLTRASTRVVVSASGAAGTNIAQPMNALGIVKAGAHAGRYVGIISTLAYANDPYPWSTNTQHNYAYSDDGGATWTVEAMEDTSGSTINGSWAAGIFSSADGSLYTWIATAVANNFSTFTQNLYRSADGGNSWRLMGSQAVGTFIALNSQTGFTGTTAQPWEPFMIEYAPGTFIVLWRGALGGTANPLAYNLVSDYGRNMTQWASTGLAASQQAAAAIYDPATQTIEIVFGFRGNPAGSNPGLYSSTTTLSDAIKGTWNAAIKIRSPYYSDNTKTQLAFYPALVMVGQRAWLFYYDESTAADGTTEIYCIVGESELRRTQRNVATASQFNIWLDDLDRTQLLPGLVLGWDMRNLQIPGLSVKGSFIREISNGQPMPIVVDGDGLSPAIWTSPDRVAFAGVSLNEALRTAPALTTWAPASPGVGLLIVADLKSGMTFAVNRKIFTLNEETGNQQIVSIGINTSGQLGVLARAGIGGASVTQNATTWATGKQLIGAWMDLSANTITLYANGTSYGPTAVNTGTAFAQNFRLLVGAVTTGGSSNISAKMDVYFAGAWQDLAGFTAARAELQTKFGVQ